MKKFFKFLFLLVFLALVLSAFLLRNDFETATQSREVLLATLRTRLDEAVYTHTPRPVRLFLFTHAPGLFPVVLVCNHTLQDGKKESIFSGDLITATNADYRFYCGNGFEATLKPGSEARMIPRNGQPAIRVLKGQMSFRFGERSPLIETELFTFEGSGQAAGNRLALEISPNGYHLACLNGMVSGTLQNSKLANGKKSYFVVRDCFFSVKADAASESHLMPGDIVDSVDLSKDRHEWAPQDVPARLTAIGIDLNANPQIQHKIEPVPSGDNIKLSWETPTAPAGLYSCTLYTQENLRTKPQAAHRFQAQANSGDLTLLKGFLKFSISMACNSGDTTLVSHVIPALTK